MNGHIYNLMLIVHLVKTTLELVFDLVELYHRVRSSKEEVEDEQ